MAQLNYFRGQTSGGVPYGVGQATNTGMAAGVSKGMDALAKGLEKFFQNKKEKAEEDAYAELLKKLNEVSGETKEVGRKSAASVASGTPGLPDFLDTAMEQISEVSGPMPLDPGSIPDPSQTMLPTKQVPNPVLEDGLVFVPQSGDYQPIVQDPRTGQNFPPAVADKDGFITLQPPIPETVSAPDLPPGLPMDRPSPEYQPSEAAMAGQQVPLSFTEQDQMRNQLIADYTQRIGTDRAEKLMGEQFKIHRDEQGSPVAYSLGKSLMPVPKSEKTYNEKDLIPVKVGEVDGVLNTKNGQIKLPTQEGALAGAVTADKKISEMNVISLNAMKDAGIKSVVQTEDGKFIDAESAPKKLFGYGKPIGRVIPIEAAIAEQTKSKSSTADWLDK